MSVLTGDTPVLILTFNRPDLVEPLINAIRVAKPPRVFLASDGPRLDFEEDGSLVSDTRRKLLEQIDWPCEIVTRFQESNLGLVDHAVSSFDWAFERCDRLVVLEDDCVPHPDFFGFCEELLVRCAEDSRVWCVLGDNSAKVPVRGRDSYTFSRYALPTWGLALWKSSWEKFDRNLDLWAEIRETPRERALWATKRAGDVVRSLLNRVRDVESHSWGYVWMFSAMYNRGLAIVPRVNLIRNLGHNRADAAHTRGNSLRSNFPTASILPLRHPKRVVRFKRAERVARNGRLFGLKKNSRWYQISKGARKFIRRLLALRR